MRIKTDTQSPPTFKGPADEENPAKETRGNVQRQIRKMRRVGCPGVTSCVKRVAEKPLGNDG